MFKLFHNLVATQRRAAVYVKHLTVISFLFAALSGNFKYDAIKNPTVSQ